MVLLSRVVWIHLFARLVWLRIYCFGLACAASAHRKLNFFSLPSFSGFAPPEGTFPASKPSNLVCVIQIVSEVCGYKSCTSLSCIMIVMLSMFSFYPRGEEPPHAVLQNDVF